MEAMAQSRPTASCSPRRTSRSAARARCSASEQSGFNDLKLGRIPRDEAIVIEARRVAEQILDDDPDLAAHAAAPRRGRGPPRRRRRVPLQVADGKRADVSRPRGLRGDRGQRARPAARSPRRATVCGRPRTSCARRCSPRSTRAARSSTRPCSTSTRAPARSRSRRCRAAPTRAVLVERDRAALDVDPRTTSSTLGLAGRAPGRSRPDVGRFLAAPPPRGGAVRPRVLTDPPYDTPDAASPRCSPRWRRRAGSRRTRWSTVERPARHRVGPARGLRTCGWERTFGDTLLSFFDAFDR